ncbi:MAG TPA: nucleotide sugar dehydrogenase [Stellaceae bacterium]|nr:nucleotide sugar dehydrogenase [Stellaceae bacterium]
MSAFPDSFRDREVCVMGLGYVGLTLGVVMADVGFRVHGVEIRPEVVSGLAQCKAHFHEPGLDGRLSRVTKSGRFSATQHIPENAQVTVFVVTVGTPLDEAGHVRVDMMNNVVSEIARHLKDGDMVVMRSTVELGTTRAIVKPILDRTGRTYDLVFCPERTLEGQALQELRELPQIVGGHDRDSRIRAAQIFSFLTPTVVQVSSLETAELIKLIDNSQRDVHFGLSNEVARIADAIGVSAVEVIRAGKLGYARTNLPMPGPVGGPCLEKDSYILANGLKRFGISPEIIMSARRTNERQPGEIVSRLKEFCEQSTNFPATPIVTLAGVAFKGRPETDDLRGTMAKPILAALRETFPSARFRGFDAIVTAKTIHDTFKLDPVESIDAAFAGANLVVIANNHPCFEKMPLSALAESMARPGVIFDFWNNFGAANVELPTGVIYTGLGELGRSATERKVAS